MSFEVNASELVFDIIFFNEDLVMHFNDCNQTGTNITA